MSNELVKRYEKGGRKYMTAREIVTEFSLGIGTEAIHERVKRGKFPPPAFKVSPRMHHAGRPRSVWLRSVVEKHLNNNKSGNQSRQDHDEQRRDVL